MKGFFTIEVCIALVILSSMTIGLAQFHNRMYLRAFSTQRLLCLVDEALCVVEKIKYSSHLVEGKEKETISTLSLQHPLLTPASLLVVQVKNQEFQCTLAAKVCLCN